jgi:hypothetical protein
MFGFIFLQDVVSTFVDAAGGFLITAIAIMLVLTLNPFILNHFIKKHGSNLTSTEDEIQGEESPSSIIIRPAEYTPKLHLFQLFVAVVVFAIAIIAVYFLADNKYLMVAPGLSLILFATTSFFEYSQSKKLQITILEDALEVAGTAPLVGKAGHFPLKDVTYIEKKNNVVLKTSNKKTILTISKDYENFMKLMAVLNKNS